MLFELRLKQGIADGTVTVAFRRWKRPQVVAGRRYRTGLGLVEVNAVDVVDPADITEPDARAAGYASVGEARAELPVRDGARLYRLRFHRVDEPDPRSELAAADDLTDQDVAELDRRLDRLDRASSHG